MILSHNQSMNVGLQCFVLQLAAERRRAGCNLTTIPTDRPIVCSLCVLKTVGYFRFMCTCNRVRTQQNRETHEYTHTNTPRNAEAHSRSAFIEQTSKSQRPTYYTHINVCKHVIFTSQSPRDCINCVKTTSILFDDPAKLFDQSEQIYCSFFEA